MKQALHIFKKDVRYLRYEVAITLVAAAIFCFVGLRRGLSVSEATPGASGVSLPIAAILPATWWFLIVRLIHAESPTGDKHFWLTRPYEWKSLLAAKALFLLLFVNLPLFVSDVVILPAYGFSVGHEWAGLLWTQVLIVIAFILPTAALASIVSGIAPLVAALLFLIVGIFGSAILSPKLPENAYWGELQWVQLYYGLAVISLAAAVVLFWQYTQRKTAASRTVAGIAAVLVWLGVFMIPWTAGFALQTHFSRQEVDDSSIHVGLDLDRKWLGRVYSATQNQTVIDLPLHISGVPSGMEFKANGLTVELRASDGEVWRSEQPPQVSVNSESGILSLRTITSDGFYTKVKSHPIQLRGTLFFTLYGNRRTTNVPLHTRPIPVRGVGMCSAGAAFLFCSSAFRGWPELVSFRIFVKGGVQGPTETSERAPWQPSLSPFPADLGISPVAQFFLPQRDGITGAAVDTAEPLTHLRRDFEIDDVRLSEFEVHPLKVTAN